MFFQLPIWVTKYHLEIVSNVLPQRLNFTDKDQLMLPGLYNLENSNKLSWCLAPCLPVKHQLIPTNSCQVLILLEVT